MNSEAGGTRRARIRWKLLLVLMLVVGGALGYYISSNRSEPILSYRVADQRTLVLTAGSGSGLWTRVTQITETEADVQIAVESLEFPVTRSLEQRLVEYTIALSRDLGDRVVRDVSGSPVPRVEPLASDIRAR